MDAPDVDALAAELVRERLAYDQAAKAWPNE